MYTNVTTMKRPSNHLNNDFEIDYNHSQNI